MIVIQKIEIQIFSQVSNNEWNSVFKWNTSTFVCRIPLLGALLLSMLSFPFPLPFRRILCFLYDKNFGMIVSNIWKELIKFPPQITLKLEVRHFSKFVIFEWNVKTFPNTSENMKLMKLNNRNDYHFEYVYVCRCRCCCIFLFGINF